MRIDFFLISRIDLLKIKTLQVHDDEHKESKKLQRKAKGVVKINLTDARIDT